MRQVDLKFAIGYELKRAQTTLRAAMDAELRTHELSVPQYSCLEHLAQRPDLSNAALARGLFVSRQATHQLLAGMRDAGLVTSTGSGRSERFALTARGRARLSDASAAVATIEERMLSSLDTERRSRLHADLIACTRSLQPDKPAETT